VLHRIPKGKIKTLTIKKNRAGQWHAIFSCEFPETPSGLNHTSMKSIGIDVGLENFAALSNGKFIANPRYLANLKKSLSFCIGLLAEKRKALLTAGKQSSG